MRAVIVNEYGSTPVVAEVATPQPQAGQVLIRLSAAGMNPMDRTLASGDWRPMPAIFPMVLGADCAGVIEIVGAGATRFAVGQNVFGQFLIPPLGSAGTYAEYVAVTEDAPLTRVPDGLDPVVASALPTAGMAGLSLVEDSLGPLANKTLLIVGAGGGVGTFATQFAVDAGARVIANVRDAEAARMQGYGAAEIVDHTAMPIVDTLRKTHPDGIDALLDVVSDADAFAELASLVRPGGTAVTTRYIADTAALEARDVVGVNFALQASAELLDRLAGAVLTGRIVAPPIARITLDEVPAVLNGTGARPIEGKTVITL
ncbi:MAG TPA: NADP-dependent oxidoreductase [Acidimicrobiales bacterium]|jgi:NADPH:quinone reductase-like Zn-dependent oxidoreductase|nr:NADP-dependent oxidoreductase [Acidimicrobiales bacterium]